MGKDFKDEDVQLGHKKLEELKESLKSLKKHADGCHRTWAEEVSAARVKIQKDVFALKGVVASATGFSQFEKYESVHNFLNGPHNTRVSEAFGKTVAGPIEAWLQHIEHSEIELKNLEKQRSAFDQLVTLPFACYCEFLSLTVRAATRIKWRSCTPMSWNAK
jgi:hypothetical protein